MHEVKNPGGRLLTFRFDPAASDAEGERAVQALRGFVLGSRGPVLAITDLRLVRALSPANAERLVALMRADNPRVERSAVLLDAGSATLVLQVKRMLNEAAGVRRAFTDATELGAWLVTAMSAEERTALEAFLS